MILQKPDLEQRLKWNLDRAISVDIATAFIGEPSSNLLKTVADYPHRIRVVVGTMSQGRSADGDRRRAIRSWARKGVSIREHNGSLHAKTYIFHHRDGARAWVGSNNLTTSAFRDNDELTLETSDQHDIEELESWFDNRWKASASRKVRSHPSKSDLLGDAPFATPVRFISDGREIDCRFAAVYMTASNTPSIYWCTTQLRDEATHGRDARINWVDEPRDAVTDKPILSTVALSSCQPSEHRESARILIRACQQAGGGTLRLCIGGQHDRAYWDASVLEVSTRTDDTKGWDARLAIASSSPP